MEQVNYLQPSNVLTPSFREQKKMLRESSQGTMPAYVTEYQQKYGSLERICKLMSFTDIGKVAADRDSAISADIPSFVRLNQTFGEKASIFWLYTHLKSLLVRFLVDEKKMSDEQVEFLANIIVTNFPSMKLTEFMLFESYFLGGRYQEFYGETSYILAITRSLQQFKKDLNIIYLQIERDKENAKYDKDSDINESVLLIFQRRWNKCHLELCQAVSPEISSKSFDLISFKYFNVLTSELFINIPDKKTYEFMENNLVQVMSSIIPKYFGVNVKLKYCLP